MPAPLFVYGTLKRQRHGKKHPLLRDVRVIGRASMRGELYDLGKYPGVVRSVGNGDRVFGELYEIPEAKETEILRRLDAYEGSEYDRQRVFVTLPDGRRRIAWVYVLRKHPKKDRRQLTSGYYRTRRS